MQGYDYGNTRIRAMKSRLLDRRTLTDLAGAGNIDSLIVLLARTAYQDAIESALVSTTGLGAVTLGLRHDLIQTARKIRGFYEDVCLALVAMSLRQYDIHNLKTILRGLTNQASPAEMMAALLPVGDLTSVVLSELANSPDVRAAVDLLATLGDPLARPLLAARGRPAEASLAAMELALDRWYFQRAAEVSRDGEEESKLFEAALAVEADLFNLQTVIRLAQTRAGSRTKVEEADVRRQLVGPGHLSFDDLVHAAGQPDVEQTMVYLMRHTYRAPLAAGLEAYRKSKRVTDIERQFRLYRLRWQAGLVATDPLGIGVFLGYFALKLNEIGNLRWIAYSIGQGQEAAAIRAGLEILE